MNIEWNKVTWYSKLGALIVLAITVALAFFLWNEYQEIQGIKNSALIETPQINKSPTITEELGDSELQERKIADWSTLALALFNLFNNF